MSKKSRERTPELEEIAAHPEKVKYATGDIRGLSKDAI